MSTTLSRPPQLESSIRRVAILFAGGPAPAANAVISTAAVSFLRNNAEVVGIKYGYSNLMNYGPDNPMQEGRDYIQITHGILKRTRNSQGILIGTSRANPGKNVSSSEHFKDVKRAAPLKTVYDALISMGIDALISIGGDDTLKTANKFKMYQELLPKGSKKIRVVHLPKTIDNDYRGIDFTFGYFTAVETLAAEIRNLLADAESTQSYYIVETMGRSAGWLAYGAAIAGEASLVISVEDIIDKYEDEEDIVDSKTSKDKKRKVMKVGEVVKRIVATMCAREKDEHKHYGVIVLAEGLAEFLPHSEIEDIPRDEHGHISIAKLNICRFFTDLVSAEYERQMNKSRKVTGLQLGYECRCARPHAFDVMLGSQLGVGAYRALVEEGHNGVMVSVRGQLDLNYVDFKELIDPKTLVTRVRHIEPDSDFHRLARFLETYVNE